jgi:pimeloyl-ACP methyl ester carboxylesterase
LAIRIAARLFITPVNFKRPKREIPMLESAQIEMLKINSVGRKIRVFKYGYSKKKVMLVHGWSGRGTQLFGFANKLLEMGYMVISFDGPSHGKSEGKTTNLKEFITTVKEVNETYGPFDAAIGHSFGSMSILNANADQPIFKSVVTIGSGDFVSDIMRNFITDLGLKKHMGYKLKRYFQNKWKIQVDDFASSKAAKKLKLPILVVHDINDGDVPVTCAENISQNATNGSLLLTSNLGHTKILRDRKVIDSVCNFIKQHS